MTNPREELIAEIERYVPNESLLVFCISDYRTGTYQVHSRGDKNNVFTPRFATIDLPMFRMQGAHERSLLGLGAASNISLCNNANVLTAAEVPIIRGLEFYEGSELQNGKLRLEALSDEEKYVVSCGFSNPKDYLREALHFFRGDFKRGTSEAEARVRLREVLDGRFIASD